MLVDVSNSLSDIIKICMDKGILVTINPTTKGITLFSEEMGIYWMAYYEGALAGCRNDIVYPLNELLQKVKSFK